MSMVSDNPNTTHPTWDAIVRQNAARVYRLAYRLTGNVHDAEDLTQETFIRVFRSLSSFKPGTMEGWIHRICVNLFLDQVRHEARLRMDALGDEADNVCDLRTAPEPQFEFAHLDLDVAKALADLPPDFRVAVVLCDIEGYSYDEIAGLVGVKAGTIASRIHRGRALLRTALAHRAPRPRIPATTTLGLAPALGSVA
jgi:RNA polymerase sigma-70 factor (ECF subfamily)